MARKIAVSESYFVLDKTQKTVNLVGNPFATDSEARAACALLPPGVYTILEQEVVVVSQPAESADGTVVEAGSGGSITDGAGAVWAINAQGQITADGVADKTTAGVIRLAYSAHTVWQENLHDLWWSWIGGKWTPNQGTTQAPKGVVLPTPPGTVPGAPGAPTASAQKDLSQASGPTAAKPPVGSPAAAPDGPSTDNKEHVDSSGKHSSAPTGKTVGP